MRDTVHKDRARETVQYDCQCPKLLGSLMCVFSHTSLRRLFISRIREVVHAKAWGVPIETYDLNVVEIELASEVQEDQTGCRVAPSHIS